MSHANRLADIACVPCSQSSHCMISFCTMLCTVTVHMLLLES